MCSYLVRIKIKPDWLLKINHILPLQPTQTIWQPYPLDKKREPSDFLGEEGMNSVEHIKNSNDTWRRAMIFNFSHVNFVTFDTDTAASADIDTSQIPFS